MSSYKQTVQDIKDYALFEIGRIERSLDKVDTTYTQRLTLEVEGQTLRDILAIIKENEK